MVDERPALLLDFDPIYHNNIADDARVKKHGVFSEKAAFTNVDAKPQHHSHLRFTFLFHEITIGATNEFFFCFLNSYKSFTISTNTSRDWTQGNRLSVSRYTSQRFCKTKWSASRIPLVRFFVSLQQLCCSLDRWHGLQLFVVLCKCDLCKSSSIGATKIYGIKIFRSPFGRSSFAFGEKSAIRIAQR